MVPALVCTFLRLSTTVHWVHPMPYKRLRVRLSSLGRWAMHELVISCAKGML